MKLTELFGLTTYLQYGGGPAHQNISSVDKFKLQRAFVSNSVTTKGNDLQRFQPTHQNFKYDDYLALCKNAGIEMIYCTQGSFDYMETSGSSGKSMPINDGANPKDLNSWEEIAKACKQIAIRYAADSAGSLDLANVYQDSTYLSNTPKAGLDLIKAIEIQNEWNFKASWSGAFKTIEPEEYAYCFMACYLAIREVSATVPIIMGGGIGGEITDVTRFLAELKIISANLGIPMPKDFYVCFHWYMRFGTTNQTGGQYGISPEEADAYKLGKDLDDVCKAEGLLGWYCTETGWSTDNSKQSAPIQQGFTREESQGVLMVRLALIWSSIPSFKGVTFWHCRDDYDATPYAKGGINYKNWSAKPARTISESFLSTYGDYEVSDYKINDGIHSVKLIKDDVITLSWTDGDVIGNVTPMPTVTTVVPPIVIPPNELEAEVTSITLVHAASKEVISELTNESQFVNYVDPLTIEAKIENGTSVKFTLTGPITFTKTETISPYVLFGDSGNVYNGQIFPEGDYSLVVEPYGVNGLGIPMTINFKMVSEIIEPPCEQKTITITNGYIEDLTIYDGENCITYKINIKQ